MNFKNSLALGILLICSVSLFSKNIYLKFDPACMDRYEYRLNGNMAGNGLISYYLKGNNSDRIMLEIGVESIKQVKRMPRGTKTCGKVSVNDLLANAVNSGKDKVYIVRPVGKNYIVSPVHLATYMKDLDNGFSMVGNQFDMTFANSGAAVMEHNLAGRDFPTKVYYIGKQENQCATNYLVKKIPEETCKPYTDLAFVPGIGVVEEKTGVTSAEAESNVLRLVRINNTPLAEYIDAICNKPLAETVIKHEPQIVEAEIIAPAVTTRPATPAPTRSGAELLFPAETNPIEPEYAPAGVELIEEYYRPQKPVAVFRPKGAECKELSYGGVHIVQTGETLYSIARKYNITVKQLRVWNDLGKKDLIRPCASLHVLPPTAIAEIPKAANSVNPIMTNKGRSAEILFPNREEVPAASASVAPEKDAGCEGFSYGDVHIVQKDETLYSIAIDNEVTVEEIVKWNKLSKNATIKPCASLYIAAPLVVATPSQNVSNTNTTKGITTQPDCQHQSYAGVHVVQRGETLYSVARKNDVTVEELVKWNKLPKDSKVKACASLYVKAPMVAANVAPDVQTAKGGTTQQDCQHQSYPGVHVVQKGETLYSVARKNNVTVEELVKWNKLSKDSKVKACASIYVRAPAVATNVAKDIQTTKGETSQTGCLNQSFNGVHVIQKGETLYSVARKNGVTVEQIATWNKISKDAQLRACSSLYVKTPESVIAALNTTKNPSTAGNYTIPNNEIGTGYTNAAPNDVTVEKGSANNASSAVWDEGIEYHVVQKGETLIALAKKYGFTPERFRHINGLGNSNIIKIGQVLKTGNCLCPADGVGASNTNLGQNHTTTGSGNSEAITSANNTQVNNASATKMTDKGGSSTTERVGTYEPVPAPYDYETEAIIRNSNANSAVTRRNGRRVHTVKENETLATIANTYNLSIEVLRKLNNMEKGEVVIPNLRVYIE